MEQLTIFDLEEPKKDIKPESDIFNCSSCFNFDSIEGCCSCLAYNCIGITKPYLLDYMIKENKSCKYHNKKVYYPSNWCEEGLEITEENKNKCISCLQDCKRAGNNFRTGDVFRDQKDTLFKVIEVEENKNGLGLFYKVKYKDKKDKYFSSNCICISKKQLKEMQKIADSTIKIGDIYKDKHGNLYKIALIQEPTYGNYGCIYGCTFKDRHSEHPGFTSDIAIWQFLKNLQKKIKIY